MVDLIAGSFSAGGWPYLHLESGDACAGSPFQIYCIQNVSIADFVFPNVSSAGPITPDYSVINGIDQECLQWV